MDVTIQSPQGQVFHIVADPSEPVSKLKHKVTAAEPDLLPDQIYLFHKGKILVDGIPLGASGYCEGDCILALRATRALGSKRELTAADLHLHFLSPFIAHKSFTEGLLVDTMHSDVRTFSKAIELEILQKKFHVAEANSLDMQKLRELSELSAEQLTERTKQEIVSGKHTFLLRPCLHVESRGILYTGQLTFLQRESTGIREHSYMMKVITSCGVARPHQVLQAVMAYDVIVKILGEDHKNKIRDAFSIISGDGTEQVFMARDFQEVFEAHREKCTELLEGKGSAPEPVAQDLMLHPQYAGIVWQQMKDLGSLQAIPGLLPLQRRLLMKWANICTLSDLVMSQWEEVKSFLTFNAFHRLHDYAKHILAEEPFPDPPMSGGAVGSSVVIDVIAGHHPSRSCILLRGSDGSFRVIHAENLKDGLKPIMNLVGGQEVFFFDKQVRDELLLICLGMGKAELAQSVLEGIFKRQSWVDISAAFRAVGPKSKSYSFDGVLAALLGHEDADREKIHSHRSLPLLLEQSRYGLMPKEDREAAVKSFEKLACAKVDALSKMAAWVQVQRRPNSPCKCSILRDDLLSLCDTFAQGRWSRRASWPPTLREKVQKWPDVYRHDLFWKVLDVVDLDQLPEEEWAAHMKCLSRLKRVSYRYRENLRPRQRYGKPYNELIVEYEWSVEQETTIKETDDVLVRQDWSLRGKVSGIDPVTRKITLVFDTNFGQNWNLQVLTGGELETISVVQAVFNVKAGKNILSQAVEAQLKGIVSRGLEAQPRCFQKFLQREPLTGSVLKQGDAKEVIANMWEAYTIIQGPPGTGKTYVSADIIQHTLQKGVAGSVLVSSNSHKAIRNLLSTIKRKFDVPVAKIEGTNELPEELEEEGIHVIPSDRGIRIPARYQVVGGTASQLLKLDLTAADYVFVDEASQVTIELLAVIAQKAVNLVIVGDQNQLPPPVLPNVQATGCGVSCMEFFTQGDVRVNEKCGIFLSVTYRMSDALTRVVSSNFYGGNLEAHPRSSGNRVILSASHGLVEVETGAQFVPVPHEGNMQSSVDECQVVQRIVEQLLQCQVVLDQDSPRPLKNEDIIIVCPYNAQVMMIKATLAQSQELKSIRVGSVDLFQGQEAAVAIISLGSSNGGGKGMGFVLDSRRTNVALSRGRALAVVVGSPALGNCRVETVQEVALQNRYATWVKENFTRSMLRA